MTTELEQRIKTLEDKINTLTVPKKLTARQIAENNRIKEIHRESKLKAKKSIAQRKKAGITQIVTTHYYLYPWAIEGDVTTIPNEVEDTVNYPNGWTGLYSLPYPTDPDALAVARTSWNQAMLDVTTNIQEYQQWGVPNFITESDNGGTPFPYEKYAFALLDDMSGPGPRIFQSMVDDNTAIPSVSGTLSEDWFLCDFTAQNITIPAVTFAGGVTQGEAVYFNGTEYAKAIANGTSAQNAVGIADVTNSRVVSFGTVGFLSGLTAGDIYYLSSVTAGAITTTVPLVNIIQMGYAESTTQLYLMIQQPPDLSAIVGSVYMSTTQSLPGGGTPTKVTFDTVEFDPYSWWDSDNTRFDVPMAGYIRINASLNSTSGSATDNYALAVYINGDLYRYLYEGIYQIAGDLIAQGSTIVPVSAEDYIEIYAYNFSSGAVTIGDGLTDSSFQFEFVGV